MKQLFLWRIVVFTIGEIEFPRIEFPTLDCRGCVALYHSFISMDEDEDDDGSGCWNQTKPNQTKPNQNCKLRIANCATISRNPLSRLTRAVFRSATLVRIGGHDRRRSCQIA